jgi:signal transduction histidine kinase
MFGQRATLRSKVFFPILLLVLTTVTSAAYLYARRQGAIIEMDLQKRGDTIVRILAQNIKVGVVAMSVESMNEALNGIRSIDDVVGAAVYDREGLLLMSVGQEVKKLQLLPNQLSFSGGSSRLVFEDRSHMDLAVPVYYVESTIGKDDLQLYPQETGEKEIIGYAVLSLGKASILAARKDALRVGLFTAILFCTAGGLIAYYIVSRVTFPLRAFVKDITQMEEQGLRVFPVRGDYEMRQLSVAFNRLVSQLDDRGKELHSLASALSLAEERERACIAGDLHDHIGQTLALAKIKIGLLQKDSAPHLYAEASQILDLISQALAYSKTLIADLSPPLLHEIGLADALQEMTEQMGFSHSLRITWENSGPPLHVDEESRTLLYKAVRELLTNVVKHARAQAVSVSLRNDGGTLRISVADDGIGFQSQQPQRHNAAVTHRFGLFNIRERLKDIGGTLSIESIPNCGTTATIVVTLNWADHST